MARKTGSHSEITGPRIRAAAQHLFARHGYAAVSMRQIAAAGLDVVHAAGPQMRLLYDALPVARRGLWAPTAAELAERAADLAGPGDIVMVKGSNGSKASLVARALNALNETAEGAAPSSSGAPRATR